MDGDPSLPLPYLRMHDASRNTARPVSSVSQGLSPSGAGVKPADKEPKIEPIERITVSVFSGETYRQELADEIEILTTTSTSEGESVVVGYAVYRRELA